MLGSRSSLPEQRQGWSQRSCFTRQLNSCNLVGVLSHRFSFLWDKWFNPYSPPSHYPWDIQKSKYSHSLWLPAVCFSLCEPSILLSLWGASAVSLFLELQEFSKTRANIVSASALYLLPVQISQPIKSPVFSMTKTLAYSMVNVQVP